VLILSLFFSSLVLITTPVSSITCERERERERELSSANIWEIGISYRSGRNNKDRKNNGQLAHGARGSSDGTTCEQQH
jgi:hypothetical protein